MKNKLETAGIASLIAGLIGLFVFSPVITFGFAYLGGMILNWIVGDGIVNGLNLVFNTERFTNELIPLTCATFATVGRYFKSTNTNNNNSK